MLYIFNGPWIWSKYEKIRGCEADINDTLLPMLWWNYRVQVPNSQLLIADTTHVTFFSCILILINTVHLCGVLITEQCCLHRLQFTQWAGLTITNREYLAPPSISCLPKSKEQQYLPTVRRRRAGLNFNWKMTVNLPAFRIVKSQNLSSFWKTYPKI